MSIEVSKSMSLTNSKFSPLIMKDGNLHFPDENMKRILSANSATAAAIGSGDSGAFCSSYQGFQQPYPPTDTLSDMRPNLTPFGVPINPYANGNLLGYPMIHPYLLESMQQADNMSGPSKPQFSPRMFSLPGQVENYLDIGPHPRRKNATRETTSILKAWLNEHQKNPYPTKGEKIMLAVITKMTLTQVSTWFANARRRLKKENKMTWSPNHKSDDEMDDLDDGDSSELLNTVSQEMNSQSVTNDFLLKLSKIGEEPSQRVTEPSAVLTKPEVEKPKIWSIADITSDASDCDRHKVTPSLPDAGLRALQCPPSSHSFPQSFLHNPAMQYILWKHKELYQLHFSNIVSNIQRYKQPGDVKSRMLEDDSKPQDNLYSDV